MRGLAFSQPAGEADISSIPGAWRGTENPNHLIIKLVINGRGCLQLAMAENRIVLNYALGRSQAPTPNVPISTCCGRKIIAAQVVAVYTPPRWPRPFNVAHRSAQL